MSLGINSLLSDIDNKMEVFRANPEQAKQRAKITGKTLDAIAAEKVLNDKSLLETLSKYSKVLLKSCFLIVFLF